MITQISPAQSFRTEAECIRRTEAQGSRIQAGIETRRQA